MALSLKTLSVRCSYLCCWYCCWWWYYCGVQVDVESQPWKEVVWLLERLQSLVDRTPIIIIWICEFIKAGRAWVHLVSTQLDDLFPLYWDLCIDHIFLTSSEQRNIVQLCTTPHPPHTNIWDNDNVIETFLVIDESQWETKFGWFKRGVTLRIEIFLANI